MPETTDKIRAAYKNAFTGPSGDIVLSDLVESYVLQSNPHSDAEMVMRFEGRRDLVLLLLQLAYGDPAREVDYLVRLTKKGEPKDGK